MVLSFLKSVQNDKVLSFQTINLVNYNLKKHYGLYLQTDKISDGYYMTRINTLNVNLTEDDHFQKINDVEFNTVYEIDDDNFENEYNKVCLEQGLYHKTYSESFKNSLIFVVEQLEILEDKLNLKPYQNKYNLKDLHVMFLQYGFRDLPNFKNLDIFNETSIDFSNQWTLDLLIEEIANTFGVEIQSNIYNNTPLYHEDYLAYWCEVTDKNNKYGIETTDSILKNSMISDDTIVCFNSYFKHYDMNKLSGTVFFNKQCVSKLEATKRVIKIIGEYEKQK